MLFLCQMPYQYVVIFRLAGWALYQYIVCYTYCCVPWALLVDCSWNVVAHGDAREGKWRGNWGMEWVASTLWTTSEHGVSSITTADARVSATSSQLNWRLRWFKWARPFRPKDEIWFLRMCHHISTGLCSLRILHWYCFELLWYFKKCVSRYVVGFFFFLGSMYHSAHEYYFVIFASRFFFVNGLQ